MSDIRTGRIAALVLPCILGFARSSSADTVTYTVDLALQTTTWTQVAPLPRFNPALGTLQGIEVTLDGHLEGTARFENRDPQPATITTDFSANLRLKRPDTLATLVTMNPTYHSSDAVSAYDGVLDFGGTSGRTLAGLNVDLSGGFAPPLPLNPVDQALFVGNGNILFSVVASGTSSATGSGNLVVNFQQRASAHVSITYQYEPPFFPDCNHNGVLDSTDVAHGTSTDCNANGLPDECEVVGEDCNDNGVPDACDFANGVLTDADHDGVPDQCTCNTVERSRGASLLVFPEYDNRDGMLTLFTVTNTSCGTGGAPIQVEFVYIDSRDCLETNRTTLLSPCDTLSLVTSAHIGGDARGFAWAFAKSQRGQAISFNWLIGTELVLDGFSALDYGVNAVSFKAIPQPDGALTDLDADGIRDLNAREYDPAPDVLLVPRFLGQLGGNAKGSELVLLNLTGGAAFTATVGLQIFNDNEEALYAQYSFRCWAKPTLSSINGAFRNSVLLGTGHDPEEVQGLGTRETGWMRIDGVLATSNQAEIVDPAILGFLVERSTTYAVADLPWEYCSQTNGDLLPLGELGDTTP